MEKKNVVKGRNWAITDFECSDDLWKVVCKNNKVVYCVCGEEVCPKTQKVHWQCFIRFQNERVQSAVRKMFPSRHVTKCFADELSNIKYCEKDENIVFEHGTRPNQGERRDLLEIKNDIVEGKYSVDELTMECPMLVHQYGRTLNKIEDIILRKKFRGWMTKGIWYHGPTGVGKSAIALKDYNPDTHYIYPKDNGWWDGYTGQETVIFNEFRGSDVLFSELLELCDWTPKTVRRRGREPAPFLARKLIITSSLTPMECYSYAISRKDSMQQLLRRFEIIEVLEKNPEVV